MTLILTKLVSRNPNRAEKRRGKSIVTLKCSKTSLYGAFDQQHANGHPIPVRLSIGIVSIENNLMIPEYAGGPNFLTGYFAAVLPWSTAEGL